MRPICLTPECAEFIRVGEFCESCREKNGKLDAKGEGYDDGIKHSSRFSKTRRVMKLAKVMTFDENPKQEAMERHIASIDDTIEAIQNSSRERLRFKTQQEAADFMRVSRGKINRAIRNHATLAGYTFRDLGNKRKRRIA